MATREEVAGFDCDKLHNFLTIKLEGVSSESLNALRQNKVCGKVFLELSNDDLKEIITLLGERKLVLFLIQSYNQEPKVVRQLSLLLVI